MAGKKKEVTPNDITRENGDHSFLPDAKVVGGYYDRIPLLPAVPLPPELEGINFYVERIDQEKAAKLMEINYEGNRPIVSNNYTKIKNDIEHGGMLFNGDAVRIGCNEDDEHELIDGQHRMLAASNAEPSNPFWTMLVSGLPVETYKTMDTGAVRSFATYLRSRGTKNSFVAAGIVNRCVYWEKGYRWMRGRDTNTTTEQEEFFIRWEDQILDIAATVSRNKSNLVKTPFTPSLAGFMLFFSMLHVSRDKSMRLWDYHVGQGLGLEKGHAAEAFLRRMRHNQIRDVDPDTGERSFRSLNANEVIAYALHTWVLFINNTPSEKMQSPRNGWNRENFELFLDKNDLTKVF